MHQQPDRASSAEQLDLHTVMTVCNNLLTVSSLETATPLKINHVRSLNESFILSEDFSKLDSSADLPQVRLSLFSSSLKY